MIKCDIVTLKTIVDSYQKRAQITLNPEVVADKPLISAAAGFGIFSARSS